MDDGRGTDSVVAHGVVGRGGGTGRRHDPGRRVCVRAAKAAERAGLGAEWVRRLARRLTRLREAHPAVCG